MRYLDEAFGDDVEFGLARFGALEDFKRVVVEVLGDL
jgi:hypothetical protein